MLSFVYIIVLSSLLAQFHTNVNVDSCASELPCSYTSQPEQLRIAIRGTDGITISWRTTGNSTGDNDTPNPQVEYSTNCDLSNSIISNGTSTIYSKLGIVSWFHNCPLNVKPSTRYYYRILASPCVNESDIYWFMSQPALDDSNPINITIVGDLGFDSLWNENSSSKTIEALAEAAESTNVFLHVGGISNADEFLFALPVETSYENIWNKFQKDMALVTAENIYMTVPGKHEVTCIQLDDRICTATNINNQYRNFAAYLHRFRMPGEESNGYKNLWYSFDYGLAHFVIINTETDFKNAPSGPGSRLNGENFALDGAQLKWLKADLAAANNNRCKHPWIIVSGYRPFYGSKPTSTFGSDNCIECRNAFARIIFDNNVDFYFNGHVPWYERLYPVDRNGNIQANNYINQTGPIYVTTGSGGPSGGIQNVAKYANASAKILSNYGYTRLEIKDSSHCILSFYDSINKIKLDELSIFRVR